MKIKALKQAEIFVMLAIIFLFGIVFGETQLRIKEKELDKNKQELQRITTKLKEKQKELNDKEKELKANRQQLHIITGQLEKKQKELKGKEKELDANKHQLQIIIGQFNEKQKELEGKEKELETSRQQLQVIIGELDKKQKELEGKEKELEASRQQLQIIIGELDKKQEELEGKEKDLEGKEKELKANKQQLKIIIGQFDEKQKELESKEKELEASKQQLKIILGQLDKKQKELEGKKKELEQTKKDLLETGQPLVILSEKNPGYAFNAGSAKVPGTLKTDMEGKIVKKLEKMNQHGSFNAIEVVGHTDERPVANKGSNLDKNLISAFQRGNILNLSPGSNIDLGMLRALAVTKILKNIQKNDRRLKGIEYFFPCSAGQMISATTNRIPEKGAEKTDDPNRRRVEIRMLRYKPEQSESEHM